jgi:dolichol kinase
MEKLTKYQKRFALYAFGQSVGFFLLLNINIHSQNWSNIKITAIVFAVLMFINGLMNGYKDGRGKVLHNIGFRYHLLTFLLVNVVYLLFVAWPSSVFTFWPDIIGIACWGVGLLMHYLTTRNTIKGYQVDELFE